jgi:hypothetical protein
MATFPYRNDAIHMGDHLIGIVKPVLFGGFRGVLPCMCQHAPYNSNGKRTHNVDRLFYDVGWTHPQIPEQGVAYTFLCQKCKDDYLVRGNIVEVFMHREIRPGVWEATKIL